MPVITIFSASHCHAEEVADRVCDKLGYQLLGNEKLLDQAASRYRVDVARLDRAMHGPRSVFNRLTHEKERNIAYLRATLAELIKDDEVVYHGFAGHLLPKYLTHVLRVCLAAPLEHRVEQLAAEKGWTRKEAEKQIDKDDEARKQWTLHLFGLGPWDKSLYDLFLPMDATTVDEAVDEIAINAVKPPLKYTQAARMALQDFLLASRVNVLLAENGHDVEAASDDGMVTLTINKYVMRLEKFEQEIKQLASGVPGVKDVKTRVGPHFNQPNIYPKLDLPKKILLVDDEREFVHTLSERLQTRNLESAVAYDGEQALSILESDAPEVMVLDLKMPGIDGLEVLRRVKREHPATEVIILTGHGSQAEREIAEELGAFAYLNKPVDIDVLAKTMKEAYRKVADASGKEGSGDDGAS